MDGRIVFTRHARERMLERGINPETVIDILRNPGALQLSFSGRKIASRKNAEEWCVVFKEEKGKTVVLTVYSD